MKKNHDGIFCDAERNKGNFFGIFIKHVSAMVSRPS